MTRASKTDREGNDVIRRNQMPVIVMGVFAALSLLAGERAVSIPCLRGSAVCLMNRLWGSLLAASAGPGSGEFTNWDGKSPSKATSPRVAAEPRELPERWDRGVTATLACDELRESGSTIVNRDFDGTSCRFVQEPPSGLGGHLTVG